MICELWLSFQEFRLRTFPRWDFTLTIAAKTARIACRTGPAAQINMMGYAKTSQDAHGIHMRLRSRAFIISERAALEEEKEEEEVANLDPERTICFVSIDAGMVRIKRETSRWKIVSGISLITGFFVLVWHRGQTW